MSIAEHRFECPYCERRFRFQCQKPRPDEAKKLALEKCISCKEPLSIFVTNGEIQIEKRNTEER